MENVSGKDWRRREAERAVSEEAAGGKKLRRTRAKQAPHTVTACWWETIRASLGLIVLGVHTNTNHTLGWFGSWRIGRT